MRWRAGSLARSGPETACKEGPTGTISPVTDCIFCAIAAGDAPSAEVLSTELVYAFRDMRPVAPTHVLVISREHIVDAAGITSAHGELLAEMFDVARRVAAAEGLAERGSRLVLNVGPIRGTASPICTYTC